jgi:hypothetical protein
VCKFLVVLAAVFAKTGGKDGDDGDMEVGVPASLTVVVESMSLVN